MQASVLTLVRGRREHLARLMEGLARQTVRPAELVVAWMQDAPFDDLPDPGCPVRHVLVPGDPMPLATARNRAAEAAGSELLVFLDVDCIPSPTVVESYLAAAGGRDGLFLGEVLYLPAGATAGGLDFARLDALGQVHPSKPAVPREGVREEPDAGELWGLSFALPRERYLAIGGMDESFTGYGGEETDFAVRLSAPVCPSSGRPGRAATTSTTRCACLRSTTSTTSCATPPFSGCGTGAGAWTTGSASSATRTDRLGAGRHPPPAPPDAGRGGGVGAGGRAAVLVNRRAGTGLRML